MTMEILLDLFKEPIKNWDLIVEELDNWVYGTYHEFFYKDKTGSKIKICWWYKDAYKIASKIILALKIK